MAKYEFEKQPICPHCDEEIDIHSHELFELYNEDDNHEIECPYCEKDFWVHPVFTYEFSTDKENNF